MATAFNLDSFEDDVQNSNPKIQEMISDADDIRDVIESRRERMEKQRMADEIKSILCDKLRMEKMSVPGLSERVSLLEESDPKLFNYVRKLEFVQDGIWCQTCDKRKTIGGKPKEVAESSGDVECESSGDVDGDSTDTLCLTPAMTEVVKAMVERFVFHLKFGHDVTLPATDDHWVSLINDVHKDIQASHKDSSETSDSSETYKTIRDLQSRPAIARWTDSEYSTDSTSSTDLTLSDSSVRDAMRSDLDDLQRRSSVLKECNEQIEMSRKLMDADLSIIVDRINQMMFAVTTEPDCESTTANSRSPVRAPSDLPINQLQQTSPANGKSSDLSPCTGTRLPRERAGSLID